jgi:hypothetical protein
LTDAFRNGGGVPFADFGPEIVEAIERLFHAGYEAWVADQWIPAAPDLKAKLEIGADVAEVGCGASPCIVPVAAGYPRSRFTGYDIDATSIAEPVAGAQHRQHAPLRLSVSAISDPTHFSVGAGCGAGSQLTRWREQDGFELAVPILKQPDGSCLFGSVTL